MEQSGFESEHIKMYLEKGILNFIYQPNSYITMEIAKKTVQDRIKFTNGIKRPILADIRGMKRVESDAQEYLASEEACNLICALGVLTDTPIQNLFANFYLKFSKPKMPTQLFIDKEKALRWLELYKDKSQN